MTKKLLIFIIILAVLIGLVFVYNYFSGKTVKAPENFNKEIAPTNESNLNQFQGPSGPPKIKGPSGPPPSR